MNTQNSNNLNTAKRLIEVADIRKAEQQYPAAVECYKSAVSFLMLASKEPNLEIGEQELINGKLKQCIKEIINISKIWIKENKAATKDQLYDVSRMLRQGYRDNNSNKQGNANRKKFALMYAKMLINIYDEMLINTSKQSSDDLTLETEVGRFTNCVKALQAEISAAQSLSV